jgi:uncharacterized membrane protein YsdA (DUF1294 family)
MSLGIAAVIIFVLYLIDKNGKWRQAGKVAVALVVLAMLGIGGLAGYDKYKSWKRAKAERIAAIKTKKVDETQTLSHCDPRSRSNKCRWGWRGAKTAARTGASHSVFIA